MRRQAHRAPRRGEAGGVVQQVEHRPVQLRPEQGTGAGGGAVQRKAQPPGGAQAAPGGRPALRQRGQLRRLPTARLRRAPGGGKGAELLHIVPDAPGAAENSVHALPLGGGEGVLLQQLRAAADDGQGGLEVVGQGGQRLGALLLHGPLLGQRPGQGLPELLHSGQALPQLPHPGPAVQGEVQPLGGDGPGGGSEEGGVPPEQAGEVPGGEGPGGQPARQQHRRGAGLKLREPPLERGGAVGHGVVELEQAHRAVGELGGAVVLLVGEAVEGAVAPQRGPGIAQVPLVHAALPHHLGGAVEGGPAVVVG